MVSPPPEAAGDAAGEDSAAGDSELVVLVVEPPAQALSRMLVPNVAEPYSKNLRRLNCLVIESVTPPGGSRIEKTRTKRWYVWVCRENVFCYTKARGDHVL